MIKARIVGAGTSNYYKVGFVKNCQKIDGEYFYIVSINKRLTMYHESQIEIL